MQCYLRPLEIQDAEVSYHWRNNPKVWELTGSQPDKEITLEIELNWINSVLQRKNEQRFAICIEDTNEYVGNVQLTKIENGTAEFHVFIGNTSFWGKGIGRQATRLMVEYGREIGLKSIYLWVNQENLAAIKAYEHVGFTVLQINHPQIKMILSFNGI